MSTLKVNTISASTSGQGVSVDIQNPKTNRNLVINGSCAVSERNTSKASIASSSACHTTDRWKLVKSSAGQTTMSQSTEAPTDNGFRFSTKYDITSAATDLSGGHYFIHTQRLEGQDLQRICKGTSSAKELTLSFWVKTNKTGLYNVELHDQDNARHCVQTYTVADANWNKYTLNFPADTTGAFDNDANASLDINFWMAGDSGSYGGGTRATTWATFAQANRAVGQVNINDSTSNEWYCTGVQLEVGSVATDFEFKSRAQELALCQRYYFSIKGDDDEHVAFGYAAGGGFCVFKISFPMPMRSQPTYTGSATAARFYNNSQSANFNLNTLTFGNTDTNSVEPKHGNVFITTTSGMVTGNGGSLALNADNGILEFEAEL